MVAVLLQREIKTFVWIRGQFCKTFCGRNYYYAIDNCKIEFEQFWIRGLIWAILNSKLNLSNFEFKVEFELFWIRSWIWAILNSNLNLSNFEYEVEFEEILNLKLNLSNFEFKVELEQFWIRSWIWAIFNSKLNLSNFEFEFNLKRTTSKFWTQLQNLWKKWSWNCSLMKWTK
jgi:hypothetical protein